MDRLFLFLLRLVGLENSTSDTETTAFSRRSLRAAAILCCIALVPLVVGHVIIATRDTIDEPQASTATPDSVATTSESPVNDESQSVPPADVEKTVLSQTAQEIIPKQPEGQENIPPIRAPETRQPEAPGQSRTEQTEPISPARVLVNEGQYYQRNGDYDTAAEKFRTVIHGYGGTPEAADAYMSLSETYKLNRQFKASIETLQEFLQQFPFDPRVERVLFFVANNYRALGEWGGAIYYYEHYAARTELLRGYAYLNIGDGYFQEGEFSKAIESLKKVLDTDAPRVPRVDAMEKIADSYFWLGQYQSAIDWYQEVLTLARIADYRADILNRIGKAYAAAGNMEQAEGTWGEVIENYPSTVYALKAVESLPKGSNPPTHYYQGLVYYNNDRYDAAIAAFNEYLVRHPDGEDVPRTYYYLALCYRYKGDPGEAFSRLDNVVKMYPNNNVAGDALWQSALLAETISRYDEAIRRYSRVANEYPNSDYAQDAIFREGLSHYKLGDFKSAQATWELLATNSQYSSKARFWAAKASLRTGDRGAVRRHLEIAMAGGNENDYYVAKAKALLGGNDTFGDGGQSDRAYDINDIPDEKLEFEHWLASWSGNPYYSHDETNPSLRADPAFRRAEELIRVGSWNEARDEFTELRQKYVNDPTALYEMAMFFRQNGLYYPSISIAMDIADMSPTHAVQGTPKFLQKLIYPVYYRELLLAEASKYGIDPLLLAAIIRQESIFDQNAESSANAKGLTQVVPSTGQGIAKSLGMDNFEAEDLFKPYVSVAFGAWYFWNELKSFDSNAYYALAAYNAGGGSVGRWIGDGRNGDDDMFVEDIRFSETQSYVKRIYRQYEAYKGIYAPAR